MTSPWLPLVVLSTILAPCSTPAHAMDDATLARIVAGRFTGDRTGACVAAAFVERAHVSTAFVCADPKTARRHDAHTTFEIGSVTKTMTATLLADRIERGELSLDTSLRELLPAGTPLPKQNGGPILLRHVVAHTSGLPPLPPGLSPADPTNPYASLTPADVFAALGRTTLARPPGEAFAYSNFAMMVLSAGLAHHAQQPFDALLRERLFEPLAMGDAYVATPRDPENVARGHQANGAEAHAWDLPGDLAGVGGVRASLDDLVHYVQAQMGVRPSSIDAAIARTHRTVATVDGRTMAMNWMRARTSGGDAFTHEGATGGFSALVAFSPARDRGVVLLSDTSLVSTGGLEPLGLHLLIPKLAAPGARRVSKASPELIDALVGDYTLEGLSMTLRRRGDALTIQAVGQPEFTMGYDSANTFYPLAFDAALQPLRLAKGGYGFAWEQGGGRVVATRVAPTATRATFRVDAETLVDYVGIYPLAPGFALTALVKEDTLYVQGTGQSPIAVTPIAADRFAADVVGAEIAFERDASGAVVALTLDQGGQQQRGEKQ